MIKSVFGVWVVPLVSLPVFFFYCTGNNCCFWAPMSQSIYYTICVCACAMCVVCVRVRCECSCSFLRAGTSVNLRPLR